MSDKTKAARASAARRGVSLSVGRGEKLSASKGAGLTERGRAKYNRATGSNLKAPQPGGGARRNSFCARMAPVARTKPFGIDLFLKMFPDFIPQ